MSKLITAFGLLALGMALLGSILNGGGGIVAVELTADITAADTTIKVVTTNDFLDVPMSNDYITIGNEELTYTGITATTFTGVTRGINGTTATSHITGDILYSAESSVVNSAMGFNMAATVDSMGLWAIPAIPIMFFIKTIPMWFKTMVQLLNGDLAILSYVFFVALMGFIITIALQLAGGRRVTA
jgi:hypothetical protein